MKILISALFLVTSSIVAGQRPSFAGFRPIGFPEMANRTTTTPDPFGNRFGEDATERLPIEANGDRDLIDRLSKLPVDKQPFWFINWQAYEKHRKEPQTFPQRPNAFVDNIPVNANFPSVNNGFSAPNPGLVGTEPNAVINRFGPTTTSRTTSQLSSNFGSGSNFNNNNNGNFNSGGNNNPSGNVYPNNNANLNTNVYPNANTVNYVAYPTSNPKLNVYPTANPNLNVYPTANPNLNVYPTANPNFNTYPNSNSNLNNYPSGNINNYPNGNTNNYPNGNTNNYPNGNTNNYTNGNTSNYPTGNFNNYPTGTSNPSVNSNTSVFHSSNFNTQSNSGTTKDGVSYYQTTQNYKWNTSWKTTNVSPTNVNKYPETYSRTDTYPQRSGRIF